ncbi:Ras-related protein Rab-21 [Nymphon striatum]|nr:Ras-related protein Rab-21 [Nymphon striatum]
MSANTGRSHSFKVVLLGEGCVGKTSVVLRYVENKFNDKHFSTLQDTAGQERFHALGPIYYRDSNGAILVYDITDEDSFLKVKNWVKELKKMLGNDICLCIAGNKTDLEKQRTVSAEEAETYAASVGAKHFHTSAKLNKGVEEMFLDLSTRMMETAEENVSQKASNLRRGPGSSQRGKNVVIVDDEPTSQKSGCCGGSNNHDSTS